MDVRKPDFMDCEAYLDGEVSPVLAAATLRAKGFEVSVDSHAHAMTALTARNDIDHDWTCIALHKPAIDGDGSTSTLVVADRFGHGPEILRELAAQFGGRWREACDAGTDFHVSKAGRAVDFSASELLHDKLSRLVSPLAAELIVAVADNNPQAAEEMADAIREHIAEMAPPRP